MQNETAEDLKRWLKRGGVEVNTQIVKLQLANRSRK